MDHDRLLAEHRDPRRVENSRNLFGLTAFIIMVAQHPDGRDRAMPQILGEILRLAGLSEIGQVTAQGEHIGSLGNLLEHVAIALVAFLGHMEVADRRECQRVRACGHVFLRCPCRPHRQIPIRRCR